MRASPAIGRVAAKLAGPADVWQKGFANQEVTVVLRVRKLGRTKVIMLALGGLLGTSVAVAAVKDEIHARLQPAGEVCVMGTECAQNVAVAAAGGAARDAQSIYQSFCFACHGTGANNAPVLGNAEHWGPRVAKGVDALYESAINGFNNGMMPAKGLCMDCSDEELHATVDYILESL